VGHLGAAQVAVERAHPGPEGYRGRGAAQVDGNDVVAVYEATRAAVERARSGKGPTLIEAVSYRLGDHTTADDATRYRDGAEVEAAWAREPVKRLRQFMFERGWWDEQQEQALLAEAGREVERAVAAYEAITPRRRRPCSITSLPSCRRPILPSASASSPRACSRAGRDYERYHAARSDQSGVAPRDGTRS
jgi:TPP-dependent pyruvate/acetoin dehydrogenase alpha subunit